MQAGKRNVRVMSRINHFARSQVGLPKGPEILERQGAEFQNLTGAVGAITPQGGIALRTLPALAEPERAHPDLYDAVVASAGVKGRAGGNPGLEARDPAGPASVVRSEGTRLQWCAGMVTAI